ncbi:hypothetical protein Rhe02_76690 [Rhizocola hellebori]|uniref:DUF4394 domain-containing protein n=1 Tax=Rhizocola hellebori TaxID=1392758 RepID=A0A8J3QGD0_9ACTN|nr:DUF4394 domain-containing protein [Rhizocola hellebori]GIH09602.1 hypothetical protein Rhe02_76690 [Rhizocola hellebori]
MPRKWVLGLAVLAVTGAMTAAAAVVTKAGSQGSDPLLVSYNDNSPDRRNDHRVIGLTGDGRNLVWFRANDPDKVRSIGTVGGMVGDTRLIGIDFRAQNGKLYGVGDSGGIYTIGIDNAKASKVSQLTIALSGQSFDIDFNPAANRLRVLSDNGQNLRHNIDDPAGTPAAGMTATDTGLTTPPATAVTTGVTGAAYTNNDTDPNTATTLFDLNVMTDQVAVQSPANQGELAPAGKLMVDTDGDTGFDIYSALRVGVSAGNTAYATLKVDGRYRLYRIDLLTGRAAQNGSFPNRTQVTDIAIQLDA